MSIEIPVSFKNQSADFELIMDFENTTITIRLTYDSRVDYWFADFTTSLTEIKNVKLVAESLLLNQYKGSLHDIHGDFIVTRVANDFDSPELTYDNFGSDWAFLYYTEAEVETYKTEMEIV